VLGPVQILVAFKMTELSFYPIISIGNGWVVQIVEHFRQSLFDQIIPNSDRGYGNRMLFIQADPHKKGVDCPFSVRKNREVPNHSFFVFAGYLATPTKASYLHNL
jgi:hypothetical protein